MQSRNLSAAERIVAPGGPVSRAVEAGRGERVEIPDLSTFPEWYAMDVVGDCCAPEIPNGCLVMCNARRSPVAGDFAVIYFTPEIAEAVGCGAWVKRVVFIQHPPRPGITAPRGANVRPSLVVEQLNPKRNFTIPWTAVREVHWCHGQVPADVRVSPSPAAEKRRAARRAASLAKAEVAA